jgi:predicted enzyme related to lactoylglutathione lyase
MVHKATLEVVLDCQDPNRLGDFWRQALDYRDHYSDTELAVLVPRDDSAAPLLLQRVPEPKTVKNRMHLDVIVDDIETEVSRLEGLGARRIDHDVQQFSGTRWFRLTDPEDNEFCVSTGIEW